MRIRRLRVAGFRNLESLDLEPEARVCVVHGANGQGKTNLLEAIRFASCLQSFRTRQTSDLVQFGGSGFFVQVGVEDPNGLRDLRASWRAGTRTVAVDGTRPATIQEYLSVLPTVVFSPADAGLGHGDREAGRRYVDGASFFHDPLHVSRIRRYRQTLRQLNAALRGNTADLPAWEQRMAEAADPVHQARARTLRQIAPTVKSLYRAISGDREELALSLEAPYLEEDERGALGYREALLRVLRARRDEDRRRGFTGAGPHRDRLVLRLDGRPLERHGSQGQRRTVGLALKLALLEWGCTNLGQPPVLLLDDPGSELDPQRLAALGSFVDRWHGQVWIATTGPDVVPLAGGRDVAFYRMEKGAVHAR
ncbi:DNA replication/repair protein RecF [Deferrisoma camini]|uniref:DNA replication/repair protein RecF n=1 Tax=Deferrisoma camini TaxID=1035120 RepID=UPI00046CF029|nr:DNA replication and repair protein RecF [Deferrisoma camini]